jgi:8-oxo-dGTP pyrophosphatase MutT (NUDIX family)
MDGSPNSPWNREMPTTATEVRQAAAIPTRDGHVCLVTSRSGKRWVIPKGCLETGKTAGEIALQEAWEEAGLLGVLKTEPVGSYLYQKFDIKHFVTVFLLLVTEATEEWPERDLRERVWLTPRQALMRIDDPGLKAIIRGAIAEREELRA